MKTRHLALALLLAAVSCSRTPAYLDSTLSPAKRTADLLRRMTPEEKIGQIICPLGWPMYDKVAEDSVAVSEEFRKFIGESHGGMLWATFRADPWTRKTLETGLNPELAARTYNMLQRYAIENSRLGIPLILAEEAPHGHMAIGTTVFPTSIGLASTWDTAAIEEVGGVIAEELRAQGGHIGYGPVIDLAREPRWSRVEETYGEDVRLTSLMAAAMVRGTSPRIVSTLKHFAAYGIPEGGHNGNPSFVGRRELEENFLPTFKAAIDAGALSVMTSYNTIDGVPSTANRELLTDVLRDAWGFDGFVVSDLESIDGLYYSHRVAADRREAGEMALRAGVDVDLGANCFPLLKQSLDEGRISEKDLDRAAGRVLRLKFSLGLFDNPYVPEEGVTEHVRTAAHMETARKVAREGVVLLENDGILPLRRDARIAVIGPNADNMYNQLGDYTAPQERSNVKTVLDGIRAVCPGATYVKGCAIRDTRGGEIARAAAAARAADVAVVVVGGSSARDFRTRYIDTGAAVVDAGAVSDMEAGEGYDRATLGLLGVQEDLLRAVKATGTPMVVVYIEGRPLDKRWASENANALLTLFYPGQEGGLACADVLFGDYNPAGRLPVSVPREAGQLPVYYNKRFPAGHDYVEMPSSPLYEFGYGLSYSTFEYSSLTVEDLGGNAFEVSFTVSNTGKADGDEVPQLYITDLVASTVRPQKQLRAFTRVNIPAGGSRRVSFTLDADDFALCGQDMKMTVEPGEILLGIGASSKDIRLTETINLK